MAKHKLNIFLLKSPCELADAIRSDVQGLRQVPVREGLPFEALAWVKTDFARPPRWAALVREASTDPLDEITSKSASALIALRSEDRVFCIVFGSARYWIQDQRIQRRFGMITTLNTVEDEGLRSVDREEFETVTRTTRSQVSLKSSMDKFGLDVQRDLLRSVTGEPIDKGFASHLTGADNLILNVDLQFSELADKCAEALKHFEEIRYRDKYGWIDNFQRVSDPELITILEGKLVDSIADEGDQKVFLSPPDIKDTQRAIEYRLPRERKGSPTHPDLLLATLIDKYGRSTRDIEWIKSQRIREISVETDGTDRDYTIFDAMVFETYWDGKLFTLSHGEWYVVAPDYVDEVNASVRSIGPNTSVLLPAALARESEGMYNARVAEESPELFALMDERPVVYGGGRSRIEVCDLFTIDKHFVHVKAKTKSSALSHLFSQGLVSAQHMRNLKFREGAAAKCESTRHAPLLLPERFRPEEHTVTYAIITKSPGDLGDALPFFSKQSLVNAVTEIRNMGYSAYLNKIPMAA